PEFTIDAHVARRAGPSHSAPARPRDPTLASGTRALAGWTSLPDRPDRRTVAVRLRAGAGRGPPAVRATTPRSARVSDGADGGGIAVVDAGVPAQRDVRRASRHPGISLSRQAPALRRVLSAGRRRGVGRAYPGRRPPRHPRGRQRLRLRV